MKSKTRKKDLRVFKNMEDSIKEMGLPIIRSSSLDTGMIIESGFSYASYNIGILAAYDPKHDLVSVGIAYGEVPTDKVDKLIRIVNYINLHIHTSHYVVDPQSGKTMLSAGMLIEGHLDKAVFKKLLNEVMGYNYRFSKLLALAITTDKDPADIMKEFVITPGMEGGGNEQE